MKKQFLMVSVLVGLSLTATAVKASGTASNVDASTTVLSHKKETLSEVIQSLIKKDFVGANASTSASLTISILENYQNNQSAYLKASKAEQVLFNKTVQAIVNQGTGAADEKTNVWVKEINKSAKAINAIWSVLATEPKIDADFSNDTEQKEDLIVVFQN
ncbi:MAG: hypothetical protein RLZZ185_1352 [Bacteroidota bacterium]|jgi:hypothetical protein